MRNLFVIGTFVCLLLGQVASAQGGFFKLINPDNLESNPSTPSQPRNQWTGEIKCILERMQTFCNVSADAWRACDDFANGRCERLEITSQCERRKAAEIERCMQIGNGTEARSCLRVANAIVCDPSAQTLCFDREYANCKNRTEDCCRRQGRICGDSSETIEAVCGSLFIGEFELVKPFLKP